MKIKISNSEFNRLVDMQTRHNLVMDEAYPEVGMGLDPYVARKDAEKYLLTQYEVVES